METVMNLPLSQSFILPSRPSTERVFTGVGDALRMALLLWRDHKARRREARALAAISDMNEHMLRDIGAPDRLISHAAAQRGAHYRREIVILSVSLLTAGLIATATPASAAEATYPQTASKAYTQGQSGVFTGKFVDGAPVYRLPPIVVVASRKVELAKMEREEQLTRAKQARTRTAARRPA
jgi:uncharacterized protein YjiS (DUF1127 family)